MAKYKISQAGLEYMLKILEQKGYTVKAISDQTIGLNNILTHSLYFRMPFFIYDNDKIVMQISVLPTNEWGVYLADTPGQETNVVNVFNKVDVSDYKNIYADDLLELLSK